MEKGKNIYLSPSTIEVNNNIVCHFKVGIGVFFNSSVVHVIDLCFNVPTLLVSKRLLRVDNSRVLLSK